MQAIREELGKKTVYWSFNRSASALEELSENTKALTAELKNSNESSTRLTTTLNRLTMAAVGIALVTLAFEVAKGIWKINT